MTKIPCSLPILTLNTKASLQQLLPIVLPWIEDVYIMDGNSTDGTVEYARSLGVRVEKQFDTDVPNQRIKNFTEMRFRLWSKAKFPWLFILDADERPGPGLLERVREIVEANEVMKAHAFERRIWLPDGTKITHAFMYPDLYIRVFNLDSGITLANRAVHERFVLPSSMQQDNHTEAVLSGWSSLDEMRMKMAKYIALDSQVFRGQSRWQIMRWGVLYNLKSFVGQCVRAVRAWRRCRQERGTLLPWSYTWLMLSYRLRMICVCARLLLSSK